MDIGLSDNSYFINIAAGGYLTELTYEVPSELKSIFGYLAYLAKGAEMLPRVKPIKMRLKYDEGNISEMLRCFPRADELCWRIRTDRARCQIG